LRLVNLMHGGAVDVDEEDLAALGRKVVDDATRLMRAEFDLVKAELGQALKRMAVAVGLIAVGAVFLLIALIEALGAVPAWLGPAFFGNFWLGWLLVGAAFLLFALLLVVLGTLRVRRSLSQGKQTFETIKEDGQWLRGLIRRGSSGS
jgi:hypothetical protein